MNHVKNFYVVSQSGLNILTPVQCNGCCNITERKFCKIWAIPEIRWKDANGCPDYHQK